MTTTSLTPTVTAIVMAANTTVMEFGGHLPFIKMGGNHPWAVSIPTYFFVISLAFCLCLIWLVRRAKLRLLSQTATLDLSLALMIGGFIGARFFHVLFEAPGHYLENPWRIFHIWQGGFVWYGGVTLGAAAALMLARIHAKARQHPIGVWLDLFAPVVAFGYAAGRVACFLTGCCFGSVCVLESGLRFRHPTQLYAIAWETATLGLLLVLEKKRRHLAPAVLAQNTPLSARQRWLLTPGRLFAIWLALHGVGRIVMEIFRADDRGPAPFGLSLATWISLGAIALSGWLLFFACKFYLSTKP